MFAQGARKLDLTPIKSSQAASEGIPRQVVYVPSCVTRMMGPALPDPDKSSVHDRLISLFKKADYEVIYPQVLPHWQALVLLLPVPLGMLFESLTACLQSACIHCYHVAARNSFHRPACWH